MKMNPILEAIRSRGVELPEQPIDLSDLFRQAGIKRVYVIGITGRCGSTWLASELKSIPGYGNPLEYFSDEGLRHYGTAGERSLAKDFFLSIINFGRTNETFGVKIDATRLRWLAEVVDLSKSFPIDLTSWIDMRRLNVVKQAFSFARAKQSGTWHIYGESQAENGKSSPEETGKVQFTDLAVWKEIDGILAAEKELDSFYKSISAEPLRIKYEEFTDSKSHILLRSLRHIFPDRKMPIERIDGTKTRKLANDFEDRDELEFLDRNASKLNELLRLRTA